MSHSGIIVSGSDIIKIFLTDNITESYDFAWGNCTLNEQKIMYRNIYVSKSMIIKQYSDNLTSIKYEIFVGYSQNSWSEWRNNTFYMFTQPITCLMFRLTPLNGSGSFSFNTRLNQIG